MNPGRFGYGPSRLFLARRSHADLYGPPRRRCYNRRVKASRKDGVELGGGGTDGVDVPRSCRAPRRPPAPRVLIDGEHVVTPSPNTAHQRISLNLVRLLLPYLDQHRTGQLLCAPFDVKLSLFTVVVPDLVYALPIGSRASSTRSTPLPRRTSSSRFSLRARGAATRAASAPFTIARACRSIGSSIRKRNRSRHCVARTLAAASPTSPRPRPRRATCSRPLSFPASASRFATSSAGAEQRAGRPTRHALRRARPVGSAPPLRNPDSWLLSAPMHLTLT